MSKPIRIAVIMAGGSGERFWPLSRHDRPKQLLRLTSPGQTMIEEAVARIAPLIPPERVFIATARHLMAPIRAACTGVPAENVIGEPCKRNTAGCLTYAAAHAMARFAGQKITMAVLTADHQIGEPELFRATVADAMAAAEAHDALATIGVVPTRAETGYGYIETPEGAQPLAGEGSTTVLPVTGFREKPDAATAREFVESGRFFWNSGMFFWPVETFLSELHRASPVHGEATRQMAELLGNGNLEGADEVFKTLSSISIDFALMEKARKVIVARAEFPWDDVGALDALDRSWPHDAAGNVTSGDPVLIDTRDCIVYNEPGAARMSVAAVGVEGLAIIVTRDGVLVAPKDRAQDVKAAVAELKARDAKQL